MGGMQIEGGGGAKVTRKYNSLMHLQTEPSLFTSSLSPMELVLNPSTSRDGEKSSVHCFQAAKLAMAYHSSYKETDTKHHLTSFPVTSARLLPTSSGSLDSRIAFPSAPS